MSVGKRISFVLTALWILSTLVMANSSYRFDWNMFFIAGVIPIVALWGAWWIFLGFNSTKAVSAENLGSTQIETSHGDLAYNEKIKRFGLQKNRYLQSSTIAVLIPIFTFIGFLIASNGGVGNKFDLAISIGYNLAQGFIFTWLYSFGYKIKLKSKHALTTFVVIFSSLMIGHVLAFL